MDEERQIKANRELARRARSIANYLFNENDRKRFSAAADELDRDADALERQLRRRHIDQKQTD